MNKPMKQSIKEELPSSLNAQMLQELENEIQSIYLENNIPWIIGYSGGKDSTVTLALVWNALLKLPSKKLKTPVYVISSDTLVETPVIVGHIEENIQLIKDAVSKTTLPFEAHIVKPKINDSFWVNLLGRGYPAPSSQFRWCTDRLKIQPANLFINERVKEYSNVIVVLGARKDESISRQQTMELKSRQIPGTKLTHHSTLSGAYCYTPIADFSLKDVWDYIIQNPSPWGADNRKLVELYKNAQSGECPLVIDTSTQSCGNSRFGCWVCTVVVNDYSMEAFVDSGERWLEPLLDFRDLLADSQKPEQKEKLRNFKRRNGRIMEKVIREGKKRTHTGEVIRGPYWMKYRKKFLRKLLEIQNQLQESEKDKTIALITVEELLEIQRIWTVEEVEDPDWNYSVVSIYKDVTGKELNINQDDMGSFSLVEDNLINQICNEENISVQLVKKLLVEEQKARGMYRRASIFKNLRRVLNEDWRSKEEYLNDLNTN